MKMNSFKKILLYSCLLSLVWIFNSKANFELPPLLENDQLKANFLGYVAEEIPWLLTEGAEYDVNFLQLLDKQNVIVKAFSEDKKYLKEIEKRKSLVDIAVTVEFDSVEKQRVPKKELKAAVSSARKLETEDAFVEKIAQLFLNFSNRNYRSIATGIISSLPPDQKSKLFKLTPEQQIESLRSSPLVTDELLKQKFRAESVGLKPSELSKDVLFEFMKQGQEIEFQLVATILAYQLESHQLPPAALKKVLTDFAWLQELNWKGIKPEELKKLFATAVKNYVDSEDVPTRAVATQFRIREVPPYLSLFRGIVGADCSTQVSGPFVFADRERTFFIYDENNNLKGYAGATLVKVNGKKALYLHDVTGSRLSLQLMKDVFHAFSENAAAFGAHSIVLPTHDQIFNNNNYVPLRTWQQSIVARRPLVNIEYLDAEARLIISNSGTVSSNGYDMPEVNATGHVLSLPQEDRYYKTKVTEKEQPLVLRELAKKDVVFLYLALTYGAYSKDAIDALNQGIAIADGGQASNFKQRIAVANQIAKSWRIPVQSLTNLATILSNNAGETVKNYYTQVRNSFKELGIDLTENEIARNQYLFYQGHVQASDSVEGNSESSRKTLAASIWLLKRWPTPHSVQSALLRNAKLFSDSVAFTNYLQSLVTDQSAQLKQLKWLLETVPDLDPLILESKGSLLEKLKSHADPEVNAAATWLWTALDQAQRNHGVKCAI